MVYKQIWTPFRGSKFGYAIHRPVFAYKRGMNVPIGKSVGMATRTGMDGTQMLVSYGVLHAYKNTLIFHEFIYATHYCEVMFIPPGYEYNDEGIDKSSYEIIVKALYWPKNIWDLIKWWFKSL